MYPDFLAAAQAEVQEAAARIFRFAMRAEEVHAGNYKDIYDNFDNMGYVNAKYAVVYRCIRCGEVVTELPVNCPICGLAGSSFVRYGSGGTVNPATGTSDGASGGGGGAVTAEPAKKDDDSAVIDEPGGGRQGDTPPVIPVIKPVPELKKAGDGGYVDGYPDNTFRPGGNITRNEAASMFYKLCSNSDKADYAGEAAAGFSDPPSEKAFVEAVGFLAAAGVLEGYEDGTFRGGNYITRAEFVKIAAFFGNMEPAGELAFTDVTSAYWAYDYIKSAYNNKWIIGYEDGSFKPENNITRAEATTILNRILGWGADDSQGELSFTDVSEDAWYYNDILLAANGI
jgi:hypothetical protein